MSTILPDIFLALDIVVWPEPRMTSRRSSISPLQQSTVAQIHTEAPGGIFAPVKGDTDPPDEPPLAPQSHTRSSVCE